MYDLILHHLPGNIYKKKTTENEEKLLCEIYVNINIFASRGFLVHSAPEEQSGLETLDH